MSLRKAINTKCRSCVYDEFAPGNWRQQVQACTVHRCPLYAVRPISSGGKMATQAETSHEVAAQ